MQEAQENAQQDPAVGTTLGGCRVLARLGKGGMGIVYKAEQVSLRRIVALKLPHLSLVAQDAQCAERFLREARTAAQLNDPNVVQVHDVGQDGRTLYIVMEFVDGESLDRRIKRKRVLPVDDALNVTLQAARGLAAAHRVNLIHRDIKPSNFLITSTGIVKLADFGLAKPVMGASELTCSSAIVGTPEYMSPEQCSGEELDPRSDIYSLGVTLYEMLAGRRPFDAQTKVAVMYKHVHQAVPNDLRDNPAIPSAVAALVDKMLAKRLEDRLRSAEELIAVLRPLIQELQAGQKPPTSYDPEKVVKAREEAIRRWQDIKRNRQMVARHAVIWGGALCAGILLILVVRSLAHPRSQAGTQTPPRSAHQVLPSAPGVPLWAKVSPKQIEAAGRDGASVAIEVAVPGAESLRMVYIPPGEFVMGATPSDSERPSDELPPHRVRITKGFYMGICEVAAGQWKAVMGDDPSNFGTDRTPVERVSWDDCQGFLQQLNNLHGGAWTFRLPAEAEWEYACRAGTASEYPWGTGVTGSSRHANIADEHAKTKFPRFIIARGEDDGFVFTAPVGSFRPNAWGLYDMIGNVQEWCGDWYGGSYYGSSGADDPPGPATGSGRVFRGGSWYSEPAACRSASRMGGKPDLQSSRIGLRLVCEGMPRTAGK